MATKTSPTPSEIHAAAKQAVDQWQTELATARAEIERLDATPSATPAEAKKVAAALATAREYVSRCEHQLEEAHQRQQEAAAAIVRAEADQLGPEIDQLREKLHTHDSRTEKLRRQLEDHTGRDWKEIDPVEAFRGRGGGGVITVSASVREKITGRLRTLETQQNVLNAAAAGEDPLPLVDGRADRLPASLKPGGIMPSPTLVERAQAEEAERQRVAEIRERLAPDQRVLDAAYRTLGLEPACEVWEEHQRPAPDYVHHWLTVRRNRVARARGTQAIGITDPIPNGKEPDDITAAFRAIVELAGPDNAIAAARAYDQRTTGSTAA